MDEVLFGGSLGAGSVCVASVSGFHAAALIRAIDDMWVLSVVCASATEWAVEHTSDFLLCDDGEPLLFHHGAQLGKLFEGESKQKLLKPT